MMEQCVIHVANSPFLASDGNVPNVQIMIYVQCVTMVTSIIYATDFIG